MIQARMRPHSRAIPALPPLLVALILLSGCADSLPPRTAHLDYLIANGEKDGANRYSSVVQVIVPGRGGCSGILAGPNLVLTAAHCLCIPAPGTLRANTTYSVTHSNSQNATDLKCSQTVEIGAKLYDSAAAASNPSSASQGASKGKARSIPFQGLVRVQIHEGYQFQTDGDAGIVASQMDLAAVYLRGEFEGVRVDGSTLDREVRTGEVLIAVGYGPTETERAGTRYFGTAKVLDIELSSGPDKVLAFGRTGVPFRDVYALQGDSGGPCFREDTDGRRWLVGIMSHGLIQDSDPITFFTSAFHHREWIKRQKLLSEQFANSP